MDAASFRSSKSTTSLRYTNTSPAATPPTITPITPGPLATAAFPLCVGDCDVDEADALLVAEELLTTPLELDTTLSDEAVERAVECDDECAVEFKEALYVDDEICVERAVVAPEMAVDAVRRGVWVMLGRPVDSVGRSGKTRPLGPKKGALEGSKRGPLTAGGWVGWCFFIGIRAALGEGDGGGYRGEDGKVRGFASKVDVLFELCATTADAMPISTSPTRTMISSPRFLLQALLLFRRYSPQQVQARVVPAPDGDEYVDVGDDVDVGDNANIFNIITSSHCLK
ncbi:hypothetical protein J1614_003215 [Plenodomus biglobosus]|nr:hypothetical protein J1614_003215 [Plenodomus biglobosus]